MDLILRIATREIEKCPELTHYNHVCFKMKSDKYGFSHIIELYDDVSDCPSFKLCTMRGGKLHELAYAEYGDEIQEDKLNMGGVYFDIYIQDPQYYFLVNTG